MRQIKVSRARTRPPAALALAALILDGAASLAANSANDARRLALELHNERHSQALLALGVALDLDIIASDAHRAAEEAARAVELEAATW